MYCPACRHSLIEGASFCSHCGVSLGKSRTNSEGHTDWNAPVQGQEHIREQANQQVADSIQTDQPQSTMQEDVPVQDVLNQAQQNQTAQAQSHSQESDPDFGYVPNGQIPPIHNYHGVSNQDSFPNQGYYPGHGHSPNPGSPGQGYSPSEKENVKCKSTLRAVFVAMVMLAASVAGILYIFPPDYDIFRPDDYVIYGSGAVFSGAIKIESDPLDTDPYDSTARIILTSGLDSNTGYRWDIQPIDYMRPAEDLGALGSGSGRPPGSIYDYGMDMKTLKCVLNPGLYSIELTANGKSHAGTFALEGEVIREYSWTYDRIIEYGYSHNTSHEFEIEFGFLYSDTLSSVKYSGARGYFPYKGLDEVLTFFVSDSSKVTSKLQSVLREEFDKKNIPHNLIDTDYYHYASYLLAFVQQTVIYVSDKELYGVNEYWAFPAETIMRGQGDCEDTSFLCASLFKAAGFETVVGILPGHAMAGVYLPGLYLPEDVAEHEPYSPILMDSDNYLIYEDIGSKRYYGCESTYEGQFPIGYTNILHEGKPLKDYIPDIPTHPDNKTFGFYIIGDY